MKDGTYSVPKKSSNAVTRIEPSQDHAKSTMTGRSIFIPFNVPSKKNTKSIWWKNGAMKGNVKAYRNGKPVIPFITSSEAVKKYEGAASVYYLAQSKGFKKIVEGQKPPYKIGFHFIKKTKGRFDFGNACQVVLDLMVKYQWIEDDSMDFVLPFPLKINDKHYSVDGKNSGVIIKVL